MLAFNTARPCVRKPDNPSRFRRPLNDRHTQFAPSDHVSPRGEWSRTVRTVGGKRKATPVETSPNIDHVLCHPASSEAFSSSCCVPRRRYRENCAIKNQGDVAHGCPARSGWPAGQATTVGPTK